MLSPGDVSFFELGVGNVEKGRGFYERLFGWTFERGPSGAGYMMETGGVPGGMHPGDAGGGPYIFFRIDDMDAAVVRVRELGGEVDETNVEGDAETVARFGRFRLCRDDQGSPFGLHEPPEEA